MDRLIGHEFFGSRVVDEEILYVCGLFSLPVGARHDETVVACRPVGEVEGKQRVGSGVVNGMIERVGNGPRVGVVVLEVEGECRIEPAVFIDAVLRPPVGGHIFQHGLLVLRGRLQTDHRHLERHLLFDGQNVLGTDFPYGGTVGGKIVALSSRHLDAQPFGIHCEGGIGLAGLPIQICDGGLNAQVLTCHGIRDENRLREGAIVLGEELIGFKIFFPPIITYL